MKDITAITTSTPVQETAPSKATQPLTAPQPAPAETQPEAAAVAAAPVRDESSVQARGSSATTVSFADASPAPVQGPANGSFSYNDRTVALFNQFMGTSAAHRGRVPYITGAEANRFASAVLTALATSAGADASQVQRDLQGTNPVAYLQTMLAQRYPDMKVDHKFGPQTLFYTVQVAQDMIGKADSVGSLQAAKALVQTFGGKVPQLEAMLAAKTLQFGLQQINGASNLSALQAVEEKLQPILAGNPDLTKAIADKRGTLQEAERQAEAARKAQNEAQAARDAETAAKQATAEAEKAKVNERRAAIDAAITPVAGSSKSDNVARHLVDKGYHDVATAGQRATLIKEMLDGATGTADEKAILQVLNHDIGQGRINETLEALGNKDIKRLYNAIDGKENDQLMTTMFGAENTSISKAHQKTFASHVANRNAGKLVDIAMGKRGPISDQAAGVLLNEILKADVGGKDKAIQKLVGQLGVSGLVKEGVDLSKLFGHMGNHKQKAEFVVNVLRYADEAPTAELRSQALNEARQALKEANDNQTVEFMKLMVGPANQPRGLHSFAKLPEGLLNQLHHNLDNFWKNTWKTDEEKQYREIISDALAVRRRAAFGSDDGNHVPGTGAKPASDSTKPAPTATPAEPPTSAEAVMVADAVPGAKAAEALDA